jgi:hypothetical protein
MPAIAYHITGHGFGHARRSVEVVRELLALRSDLEVYFRTTANPSIFQELAEFNVHLERVELDPGAIEKDLFTIDHAATIAAVRSTIAKRGELVEREISFLRQGKIQLILCDIPFQAGDIAAAAGIPIIGITNFTWDWIYEPFFGSHGDLLREVQNSYKRIPTLLKIPFGGRTDWFSEVIDIPLIASAPRSSKLDPHPRRVLISLRGGILQESLMKAANSAPEYEFLSTTPVPSGLPKNLIQLSMSQSLTFSDLLAGSSIVLSKLGYGIVTDCLATRKPILWPRRSGFREDEVTLAEASPYLPMLEIPHADLFAGNWKPYLDRVLEMKMPEKNLPTHGAEVAARIISSRL